MAKYLPFKREMRATDHQIREREARFQKYDTYGIPYGILDSTCGEGKRTSIEKDWEAARTLIMQGKELPKDLEERMLNYKKKDLVVRKK